MPSTRTLNFYWTRFRHVTIQDHLHLAESAASGNSSARDRQSELEE